MGVRAHDFGRLPAEELARRIAAKNFECVQLAPNKAIAGPDFDPGELDAGTATVIAGAFRRHDIEIAVLGCYINPIHPDLPSRELLLNSFKEHLHFARDLGCGVVALESGSINSDYSPCAGNEGEGVFQSFLASLSGLVAEAEDCGVVVGLEPVVGHTVSSPGKMRRVLESIASKNLQVVFDPVNLLSPANCGDQQRVVEESLALFGDRIAVVHAKDFRVEGSAWVTDQVGRGEFRYDALMRGLAACNRPVTLVLEGITEASAPEAVEHLSRAASGSGLQTRSRPRDERPHACE